MARQRIRLPKLSGSDDFYDIIDFNVGKTVDLHGRLFKITNCDDFTRVFLNRLGIAVPDPIAMPADPYTLKREQVTFFLYLFSWFPIKCTIGYTFFTLRLTITEAVFLVIILKVQII